MSLEERMRSQLLAALEGLDDTAMAEDEATAAQRVRNIAGAIGADVVANTGGPEERQRLWLRLIGVALIQAAKVRT